MHVSAKTNPLPPLGQASTTVSELESLILPNPPPLAKAWLDYELASPHLPKKRIPILDKQVMYAREQRELLARVTRKGEQHEDLAEWSGDDDDEREEEGGEEGGEERGEEEEEEEEEDEEEEVADEFRKTTFTKKKIKKGKMKWKCRGGKGRGRKRRFIWGDIKVPARDGHQIPVRWWELPPPQPRSPPQSCSFSHSHSSSSSSCCSCHSLPDTVPRTIVFYIHGGGLKVGMHDSEELSCRRILLSSSRTLLPNLRVYSVGYRLMPSHAASTCVSDTVTAFKHVLSLHSPPPSSSSSSSSSSCSSTSSPPTCPSAPPLPSAGPKHGSAARAKFYLVGSSSGGQLATYVSQLLPPSTLAGVVLRSPVTSDIFSGTSFVPAGLQRFHTSATPAFVTVLSGFMRRDVPRDGLGRMPVEALTQELEGLPPHYIQLTTNDTLYSDGLCYAKALMDAAVRVKVQVETGWPHTFWLIAPEMPQSLAADWRFLRGLEWVAAAAAAADHGGVEEGAESSID